MTATNDDLGAVVGANNLLSFGRGADLTPASNAITITDRLHFLETGSFHTINVSGGNPSHAVDVILVPKTGATVTVTASGGNIAGTAPQMAANVPVYAAWDGTNWRFENVGNAKLTGAAFTGPITSTSTIALTDSTGTIKERGRSVAMGEWTAFTPTISVPSGTISGGTVTTARYMLVGKTMTVALELTNYTITGTPNYVQVAIPGAFLTPATMRTAMTFKDNGAFGTGQVGVGAGLTSLFLSKDMQNSATWSASAAASSWSFVISFQIT